MCNTTNNIIDLGEVCVHCGDSVAAGSGKYVNRYPVIGFENLENDNTYNGYCCDECEQWNNMGTNSVLNY